MRSSFTFALDNTGDMVKGYCTWADKCYTRVVTNRKRFVNSNV